VTGFAECRDCGGTIVWVRTAKGKNMPIDPQPVEGGRVVLRGSGDERVARVLGRSTRPLPDEPRFESHFATCPARSRRSRSSGSFPTPPPDGLRPELLRDAIQLCHPDRHPPERSEIANRVTAALISLREGRR
jgi:hypothetical protein